MVTGVLLAFLFQRRKRVKKAWTEAPDSHAFLSHDWGTAETGHANHKRVSRVNAMLNRMGVKTWFDEQQLGGQDVVLQITAGIDKAKCFVVFLTQRYMDKVNEPLDDRIDYCKVEFRYAVTHKGAGRIIVVVMEPELLDITKWTGAVGGLIGTGLYINMTKADSDADVEPNARLLAKRVADMSGVVLPVVEAQGGSTSAGAASQVVVAVAAAATHVDGGAKAEP